MGDSAQKTLKYPAALVLSAGLGLGAVMPAPAFAAPPPPPPVVAVAAADPVAQPPDRQAQLKKALITEKDVPHGFKVQDDAYLVEMFESMLGERRPDTDPCAVPGPAKDVTAPAKGNPAAVPGAAALFLHDRLGTVVVETLAATGAEVAVDTVDDLGVVLAKCPVAKAEGVTLTMRPLEWDPPFGDRSKTVGMAMEMDIEGVELGMHGKLAQVAYRDVSLTVGLIGPADPEDRHFKKVVSAAVRKLVTSAGLFTTEKPQKP